MLLGSVGDRLRRRTAIGEAGFALAPVATDPLRAGPLAHSGGLGRLRERPALFNDAADHDCPALWAEGGVSVQLHPVSSLELGGFDTPASKEARMNNVVRNYI